MKTFVASRLGSMVAILVALTAVMFVLQNISPLDPVKAQLGAQASADAVAANASSLRCGARNRTRAFRFTACWKAMRYNQEPN